MAQGARLETVLGRLQILSGRRFTDNCIRSEHYGESYSISRIVLSPKGRIHMQVTYEDGARMPILLDSHSDDIEVIISEHQRAHITDATNEHNKRALKLATKQIGTSYHPVDESSDQPGGRPGGAATLHFEH